MKNFKFIPYDRRLVTEAQKLRKNPTEAEKKFWNEILKNKKLSGLKFTRQKPLDFFIVDFYCAELGLIIELDGKIHKFQKKRDQERDNLLKQKFRLKTLRYANEDVLNDIDTVMNDLLRKTDLL